MKSRIVVCAMVALVAVPWFIEFAAGQSTLPLTKQQQTSGAPQFLMLPAYARGRERCRVDGLTAGGIGSARPRVCHGYVQASPGDERCQGVV